MTKFDNSCNKLAIPNLNLNEFRFGPSVFEFHLIQVIFRFAQQVSNRSWFVQAPDQNQSAIFMLDFGSILDSISLSN